MYWRIAALIILIATYWVHLRPRPTPMPIPGDLFIEEKLRLHGIFPASNQSNPLARGIAFGRKHFQMNQSNGDTTAIVLNWSRPQNVVLIVAALCQDWLNDVVSHIFIWNNNPSMKLTYETFHQSNCPNSKLHIYNSPENIYFRARFLACQQANTSYCFMQDDDYLVHPNVVRNVHDYLLLENFTQPLYLLPAEEHLQSRARTVTTKDAMISSSFAWLGYGAYLPRDSVYRFLATMDNLNTSTEEKEMSDNYFSILYNHIAEVWFDHDIPLGGGQPFTVGSEGTARNDRHAMNAIRYLRQSITGFQDTVVNTQKTSVPLQEHAPCRTLSCVIHTNITFVPPAFFHEVESEMDMLNIAQERMTSLDSEHLMRYINHPLSHAVDQNPYTAFVSQMVAQQGDQITLDLLRSFHEANACLEVVFLTDLATSEILSRCQFGLSTDNVIWHTVKGELACRRSGDMQSKLYECSIGSKAGPKRFARALYEGDTSTAPWTIHEVWIRERPCIPADL